MNNVPLDSAKLQQSTVCAAYGADATAWLDALKKRTIFWCAQVLGGAVGGVKRGS